MRFFCFGNDVVPVPLPLPAHVPVIRRNGSTRDRRDDVEDEEGSRRSSLGRRRSSGRHREQQQQQQGEIVEIGRGEEEVVLPGRRLSKGEEQVRRRRSGGRDLEEVVVDSRLHVVVDSGLHALQSRLTTTDEAVEIRRKRVLGEEVFNCLLKLGMGIQEKVSELLCARRNMKRRIPDDLAKLGLSLKAREDKIGTKAGIAFSAHSTSLYVMAMIGKNQKGMDDTSRRIMIIIQYIAIFVTTFFFFGSYYSCYRDKRLLRSNFRDIFRNMKQIRRNGSTRDRRDDVEDEEGSRRSSLGRRRSSGRQIEQQQQGEIVEIGGGEKERRRRSGGRDLEEVILAGRRLSRGEDQERRERTRGEEQERRERRRRSGGRDLEEEVSEKDSNKLHYYHNSS